MSLLPTTNISFSNIANTFSPGKAVPFSMSDYYKGGAYVASSDTDPNGTIPTTGEISFGGFRGTTKPNMYNPFMWFSARNLKSLSHGAAVSTWNSYVNSKVATGKSTNIGTVPVPSYDKNTETYPFVKIGLGVSNTDTYGNYFDCGAQTMNIATNGGFTFVGIIRFNNAVVGYWERVFDFGYAQNNSNIILGRFGSNAYYGSSYRNGTSASDNGITSATISSTWEAIAIRFKPGEHAFFNNITGSTPYTATNLATLENKNFAGTYIGKSYWGTGNPYANLSVRELVFYDKPLTNTEVWNVATSLKQNYGM